MGKDYNKVFEETIENADKILDAKKEDIINKINEINEEMELYEEDDVSDLLDEKRELEKELKELNKLDPFELADELHK